MELKYDNVPVQKILHTTALIVNYAPIISAEATYHVQLPVAEITNSCFEAAAKLEADPTMQN